MRLKLITALPLLTLLAAGCSSVIYEGRYAWEDGWRQGEVIDLGLAPTSAENSNNACKVETTSGVTKQRYLTIRYNYNSKKNGPLISVPVANDAPWKTNDSVYVNVRDCKIAQPTKIQ